MWRKLVLAIGLTAGLASVIWSQVNPVATLTIHGYQTTTGADSLPGVTLSGANADIQDVRVWVDQDSCDFSLPVTLAASWAITEEFTTQGYTYCHARTLVPTDAIRSGQILDIAYTGTDSVQMLQSGTFQTRAVFYSDPDQKFVEATTTIAGTAGTEFIPSIVLTLFQATDSTFAGLTVTANVDVKAIQIGLADSTVVYHLNEGLVPTWTVNNDEYTSGKSIYSIAAIDTGYITSGTVIDIEYSGADTLVLDSLTTSCTYDYPNLGFQVLEPPDLTLAGSIVQPHTLVYTLSQGVITATSSAPLIDMSFRLNREIGTFWALPGDSLHSSWKTGAFMRPNDNAAETRFDVGTAEILNTFSGTGEVVQLKYSGPDTLRFSAFNANLDNWGLIWTGSGYEYVYATIDTTEYMVANVDSFALQGLHPGVMGGYDKGHSGLYPATFPDTLRALWTAVGFNEGAPTFHIGDYVISTTGKVASPESSFVVCRADSDGTLVWSTNYRGTAANFPEIFTWPIGAWMGADSLVYVTNLHYNAQNFVSAANDSVWALAIEDGSRVWATPTNRAVNMDIPYPNGALVMDDGDIVMMDWTSSSEGIARFEAADGSIAWKTDTDVQYSFQQAASLVAYTGEDGVEYIALYSLDGLGSIVTLRASDGLLVHRQSLGYPKPNLAALIVMQSVSSLVDSTGIATTLFYGNESYDKGVWRTGILGGGTAGWEEISWNGLQTRPRGADSRYAWIAPSLNDSLFIHPAAVITEMNGQNGARFISASVPGSNGPAGYQRNSYIWDFGSDIPLFTIATDLTGKAIIAARGSKNGTQAAARCYSSLLTQSSIGSGQATLDWELAIPNSRGMSEIAASGDTLWMNFGGVLTCYTTALTDSVAPPHGGRPPKEEIEP